MKLLIVLFAVIAVGSSFPYPRFYYPYSETYAASLGGAPVGFYNRENGPFGPHIEAGSLGGAPVGLYERDLFY